MEELKLAAWAAVYRLRNVGRALSHPMFTDRGGDGPLCLRVADRLEKALEKPK